ncbi:MAG: DUF7594 domain-containing protein [Luteolibacter sp.]
MWLGITCVRAETITVLNSQTGTTPSRLGYNLGHFMPDSNAADWFRYSGVNAARIFMSVSQMEPSDDIPPVGDGVTSEAGFFARRALLRANAASTTETLSNTYVKWSVFTGNFADVITSGNRMQLTNVLPTLRDSGVEVLSNLSASPSRFPITDANDWGGKWELWQHYYAEAFLLSRDYGVRRFSMYNEPNGTSLTEAEWLERLRICSDAIQGAIADMNSRYGKTLVPEVFAPNTASGAPKYNTIGPDEATTDTWGHDAVASRHLLLDGSSSPSWMNFQVYNYQKYTHRQIAADGLSGFVTDYDELRGYIDADMSGEPQLPMALTEFNVRTGASYDTITNTQDTPFDYASFGASCIALTERGVSQLYMFKFGQTSSASVYGIAKNGSHYVQNESGSGFNYGGATRNAEVYRLFVKAAKGGRPRLDFTTTAGAAPGINTGVWSLITHDPATDTYHVFVSNRNTAPVPLEVDFSALPVAPGNPAFIEEVSGASSGGIVRMANLAQGKLPEAALPAESVWLVTVPGQAMNTFTSDSAADTQLSDGAGKNQAAGAVTGMEVRADGSIDGRRVSLIKIPVPAGNSASIHSVLLEMKVATTSGTDPVLVHVYGVTDNNWTEGSTTWAGSGSFLKQNVPAGDRIGNNVVAGQGGTTRILGQVVADSPIASPRFLDVTDFAKSRSDGFASFLIVQDHRWDVAQPDLTPGDTQPAGLIVTSKEGNGSGARLVALSPDLAPVITTQPQSAVVGVGSTASFNVVATGTDPLAYQWRRNGVDLADETSSSLNLASAETSDAGEYTVLVSNTAGSVVSDIAVLAVDAAGVATVAREANIRGGTYADSDVDEAAAGYLMVKFNAGLDTARKAYFQFDLPPSGVDLDAAATFTIGFTATFAHRVQLWGMNQAVPAFSPAMTWNGAPANDPATNGMLTSGVSSASAIGPDVRISPGGALTPYAFTVPRLGDHAFGGKVTLVLSGVDDASNNSGGLRIAPGSATLNYALTAGSPWTIWRQVEFGEAWEDELVSGAPVDPDHDGFNNLLEYALGGRPLEADNGFNPTLHQVGQGFEYRFSRNTGLTDLRMVVQIAGDLNGEWEDAAVSTNGGVFVAIGGGVSVSESTGDPLRDVIILMPDDPLTARRFVRLLVELVP